MVINSIDDYKKILINMLYEQYPEIKNILSSLSNDELVNRYINSPELMIDFLFAKHEKEDDIYEINK